MFQTNVSHKCFAQIFGKFRTIVWNDSDNCLESFGQLSGKIRTNVWNVSDKYLECFGQMFEMFRTHVLESLGQMFIVNIEFLFTL